MNARTIFIDDGDGFFIFEVNRLYRVLKRLNNYELLAYADFRDLNDAIAYVEFLKEKK